MTTEATTTQTTSGGGAGTGAPSVLSVPQETTTSAPAANTPPAEIYPDGDWRKSLPPELQQEAMFKTIHDVNSLAKSYVHAQKMIGADKVPIPGKHATEEDWNRFYQKVGLPETPESYQVQLPKDAKFINPELLKELAPVAHKAGILPKQLEQVLSWYESNSDKNAKELQGTIQQKTQEGIDGLKKEWGKAYGTKITIAQKALSEFGPEGISEYLDKTGLGNDPMLIRMLASIGSKLYKEDSIVSGVGPQGVNTPDEAQRKVNDILANPQHPYHDSNHPNHANAVQEVRGLFDQIHPSST